MPKKRKLPPKSVELPDDEKLSLLNAHAVVGPDWEGLDEIHWCLHCEKVFTGRSVRVYPDDSFPEGYSLECGTPGCDGTPLDWKIEGHPFQQASQERDENADKPPAPLPINPSSNLSDVEPAGEYGPQIELVPIYRDAHQRKRLRKLFWNDTAKKRRGVEPTKEFSKVVCEAAKAALIRIFTEKLGSKAFKNAKIFFPARFTGFEMDELENPDVFHLEVEFASTANAGTKSFPDDLYRAAYGLIEDEETQAALMEHLRLALAAYVGKEGAANEAFTWTMEITEYGGG